MSEEPRPDDLIHWASIPADVRLKLYVASCPCCAGSSFRTYCHHRERATQHLPSGFYYHRARIALAALMAG